MLLMIHSYPFPFYSIHVNQVPGGNSHNKMTKTRIAQKNCQDKSFLAFDLVYLSNLMPYSNLMSKSRQLLATAIINFRRFDSNS